MYEDNSRGVVISKKKNKRIRFEQLISKIHSFYKSNQRIKDIENNIKHLTKRTKITMAKHEKVIVSERSTLEWTCPECGRDNEIDADKFYSEEVECEACDKVFDYDME